MENMRPLRWHSVQPPPPHIHILESHIAVSRMPGQGAQSRILGATLRRYFIYRSLHFLRGLMKRSIRSTVILFIVSVSAAASSRIDLNRDWQFRVDPHEKGEISGWQKDLPSDTESVDVPHTWNIGKHDDYLGKAWYFRSFEAPIVSRASHVELHFGATFYSSRIWLNGAEVGMHEGGYTAYSLDITSHLLPLNYLAVEIDNRLTEQTIPGYAMRQKDPHDAWYDWWDYGGIVRDVWLTTAGPVEVQRQRIRSEIRPDGATVRDQIFLASRLKS